MQVVFLVGSQELFSKLVFVKKKKGVYTSCFQKESGFGLVSYLQLCCVLTLGWVLQFLSVLPDSPLPRGCSELYNYKVAVSKDCSSCATAPRPAVLLDCKVVNINI